MTPPRALLAAAATLCMSRGSSPSPAPPPRLPGPDSLDLPALVHIDWRRLPDLPRQGNTWSGVQDSDGAWLDDTSVLTAFGYSSGGIPGFLNTAHVLNMTKLGRHATTDLRRDLEVSPTPPANKTVNWQCSTRMCQNQGRDGCPCGWAPVMCYTAGKLFPAAANHGCAAFSCAGAPSVCDSATGLCTTNGTTRCARTCLTFCQNLLLLQGSEPHNIPCAHAELRLHCCRARARASALSVLWLCPSSMTLLLLVAGCWSSSASGGVGQGPCIEQANPGPQPPTPWETLPPGL